MWTRSRVGVLAAFVGGLAAVVVVGVATREDPVRDRTAAEVRADFLERWEAWRRVAVRYTETTERDSGEQQLVEEADIVQRFPDRLVRTAGGLTGRIDGRSVVCGNQPGVVTCLDQGPDDAAAGLADELERFRSRTSGDDATYRLADRGEGCFRLRHLVDEVVAPWGDRTDLCFDRRTGAIVREVTVT